jgi:hypothetical protein
MMTDVRHGQMNRASNRVASSLFEKRTRKL